MKVPAPSAPPMPWSAAAVHRQIQAWTAHHTVRVQVHWSAHGVTDCRPREERPSEARTLDALEAVAVHHIAERGPGPFALATGLLMLDAVDQLRRTRGFVAAPSVDLAALPRQIAGQVFGEVEAAFVAQPVMPWAHDLSIHVRAREVAAGPAPVVARWPGPPRPRTFQAMVAERLGAGAIDALLPRVAVVLRDAEAQAIVDLRGTVAVGADPGEVVQQLGAVARTRRAVHLDRALLHECVLVRVPAC